MGRLPLLCVLAVATGLALTYPLFDRSRDGWALVAVRVIIRMDNLGVSSPPSSSLEKGPWCKQKRREEKEKRRVKKNKKNKKRRK